MIEQRLWRSAHTHAARYVYEAKVNFSERCCAYLDPWVCQMPNGSHSEDLECTYGYSNLQWNSHEMTFDRIR